MGYFSRLAVDLLEESTDREDRELIFLDDEGQPTTNQELAIEQYEDQYSIWDEKYRQQQEQQAAKKQEKSDAPKVYQKNKRP